MGDSLANLAPFMPLMIGAALFFIGKKLIGE
jgi:hypothetical protein